MVRKKQKQTLDPSLYENLHNIPCPDCTGTDLFTPDGQNINCRNCERSWTPEAFSQRLDEEAKG